MKTILILEDNVKSRSMLIKIIERLKLEVIIKEADSLESASILSMKYRIDLFILDIMLNTANSADVSGMQFADYIRNFPKYKYTPIIFITALEDPELHAYSDLHCYSYIEKPYDASRVATSIAEALAMPRMDTSPHNVFFRKDGILYKKDISDIVYIENTRASQLICCVNGNLQLPYKPLKKILEELASEKLKQCSRYHIVNVDYIDKIDIVNRYISIRGLKEQIELGSVYKKSFLSDVLEGAIYIK